MKILFISNLFPNTIDPSRGLFSYNQLKAMRKLDCDFRVIAPVAHFPLIHSGYAEERGRLPEREEFDGFEVLHPKSWYLPRSRGAQNAYFYRWSVRSTVERLIADFQPQVLWASFAFPDGVAAAGIADAHGLPLVVSLLGSDINLNMHRRGRRRAIIASLRQAALVLAKSQALRDIVVDLGVPAEQVILDYNGVDCDMFRAMPREEACRACGLEASRRRVLFVGNFVKVKDIPTLLRAFASIAQNGAEPVDLVLLGDGPLKGDLLTLAEALGVGDRVQMPGAKRQQEVATWMAASDVLCLPSRNEGVPNVVLEGFASGIPVVASRVGGVPEVHPGGELGALFDAGNAEALADSLKEVLHRDWNRDAIRAHAGQFTWQGNAENVLEALQGLVKSGGE